MQSQSMQKAFHDIHTHKYSKGQGTKNPKADDHLRFKNSNYANNASADNKPLNSLFKKNCSQLAVSQGKSPKS